MTDKLEQFPADFVWGTATASYQIEGGANEDGRGESIWDRFSHTPGKVNNGDSGDVACDHYHRYEDDIRLMAELGIRNYRFSVAWPRLFPQRGTYNEAGMAFYKRLLACLKQHGIQPAVTIYHWDLPQWLQDEGGWTNRETVDHYLTFARKLFTELGSEVSTWITHNEPFCSSFLGHGIGVHAPGHKDWREAVLAAHHILLSHGKAVQLYRSLGLSGQIGITLNLGHTDPASGTSEDLAAADRADAFANRWFLDPVFKGQYPEVLQKIFDPAVSDWSFIQAGDMESIQAPIDFLGVNYYTRSIVKASDADPFLGIEHLPAVYETTEMGWEVYPDGLYQLLKRLEAHYSGTLPLYITENGAAFADEVHHDTVHDPKRVKYLQEHFQAALRFIAQGGNLLGFYVWSFMDNFEWAEGYSKRFGIVHVDYETQERIPKTSAKWYKKVIATNQIFEVAEA